MSAILPDLNRRLHEVLSRCGPFDSNAALYTSFTDARIAAWRDRVPDSAYNRAERITALIDALCDQYNTQGNNALVLFLRVLQDTIPAEDACFTDLASLIRDLAPYLAPGTPDAAGPPPALADYLATLRARHSQL